ncbi:MAG: peptidylprolyl isomerase [Desulfobacterales bacterium]|nr:peptidylprolyl isomerase [Desulfobacterales bacterium]
MNFRKCNPLLHIPTALALILVFMPAMAEEKKPSEDKVAVVNGIVITRVQYNREVNIQRERVSRQGRKVSEAQLPAMRNQVLEGLIEREILVQESRKAGIRVSDQKIDEQMANIKKRYPDENEFKNALSKMGFSEDEVKTQIEQGLAIRELIDKQIAGKVEVTDKESKVFYDGNPQLFKQPEQVKASHILIKADAKADEAKKAEAQKKIKEVQQKLKDGGDFSTLAKEFSEGPSNVRGGDLGYFNRGQMVKPFEDAAFTMQPNEVSDVVETRFGYHLIKVYDKKPEQVLAYADVKEKLIQHLKKQKVEKQASEYIDQLKKNAKIEKFQ